MNTKPSTEFKKGYIKGFDTRNDQIKEKLEDMVNGVSKTLMSKQDYIKEIEELIKDCKDVA